MAVAKAVTLRVGSLGAPTPTRPAPRTLAALSGLGPLAETRQQLLAWPTDARSRQHERFLAGWTTTTTVVVAAAGAICRRLSRRSNRSRSKAAVTLRAGTEVVTGFVTACSMAVKWEDAVEEVAQATGTGYECGIAFIHELHVTTGMEPVLAALQKRLGVQNLIGCAVSGTIGQAAGERAVEYNGGVATDEVPPIEVERLCAVSVGLLKSAGATPFFLGGDGQGDLQLLEKKAGEQNVRSILVLADPFGPAESILARLDEQFPQATKAGGIACPLQVGSQDRLAYMPCIAIASEGAPVRMHSKGVIGLMLSEVDMHTIVCQGCCGAGPAVKVTEVRGGVLCGIGGRPAGEALRLILSNVDPEMRQKMARFLTLGVGRPGEHEADVGDGDWLIRAITGVTPEGGLVVGDNLEEGQPMRFHVRDAESAENDRTLMLNRYRLERGFRDKSGEPMGSFLFSCNGRGEGLYERKHVDSRAAADVLGSQAGTRVAGFFCNGEIGAPGLAFSSSPSEDGPAVRNTALHGFTAVFAVLSPAA